MTASARVISIEDFIDSHPLSPRQLLIAALCFVTVLFDGFDSILIGYVAPAIRQEWSLGHAQLGPLFGSGVAGLMIGAIAIGPFADRFGRKAILIGSVALFGVLTLASAAAPSLLVLIVLRFLTGLGLGGAMPSAITVTSEYCPRRYHALIVTTMFCGFTGGAAISGIGAAWLVSDFGWRSVFFVGGLLPIVLLPMLYFGLLESVRFLALKRDATARIAAILGKIAPSENLQGASFIFPNETLVRFPVARLFAGDVRAGTFLIWIVYFANLLVLLFLNSWLPTLLLTTGVTLLHASALTSTFQIGGTLGAIGIGYLMDRMNACYVLAASFVVGGIALLGIGDMGLFSVALIPVLFLIGVGTGGAQTGAHAVTTSFYPTASRATGMSWALGIGRIGSIVGSMSGGYMMAGHWNTATMFNVMSVVLLIAGGGTVLLSRQRRLRDKGEHGDRPGHSEPEHSPIA
jgi:AAHS family 4-hydroxybenzoate transporter-like MFS transporter